MAYEKIQDQMQSLTKAIVTQLSSAQQSADAANDRADAAENALSAMRDSIVEALSSLIPTNDNGLPTAVTETDASQSKPTRRSESVIKPMKLPTSRRSKTSDDDFIAALNFNWQTAREIRETILAKGAKVSEGTVYNRLRKLRESHADTIDSATSPERYRIRSLQTETKGNPKPKTIALSGQTQQPSGEQALATRNVSLIDPEVRRYAPILHHGDSFEIMKTIRDGSVDLILADLPYGTTGHDYDQSLPLNQLFDEYRRIIKKPTGNVVLFASQPFTTDLINAGRDIFRYQMVWQKNSSTGFHHAPHKPLKQHEDILVFSFGTNITARRSSRRATFNPQGAERVLRVGRGTTKVSHLARESCGHRKGEEYLGWKNCPTDVLKFAKDVGKKGERHPFAKPVALLEYLIRSYSNEGDVVLDNTMGSGSTCLAAANAGRRSIGIEKDAEWFSLAKKRTAHIRSTPFAVVKEANPTYSNADVALYQGDSLDVMRTMKDGSVDLVVTSPPYNLGWSNGRKLSRSGRNSNWKNCKLRDGYASYSDDLPYDQYVEWQKNVLRECWRLIPDEGAIFYNHKPRPQGGVLQTPLDLNPNLPVRQILIWNRNCGPNFNDSFFRPSHEWIVIFAKPKFKLRRAASRKSDVWSFGHERNNSHPAPFPVELPRSAIESTDAKTVLDPFSGSGTTGLAALECRRKYIGIELDTNYLAQSAERLGLLQRQAA